MKTIKTTGFWGWQLQKMSVQTPKTSIDLVSMLAVPTARCLERASSTFPYLPIPRLHCALYVQMNERTPFLPRPHELAAAMG